MLACSACSLGESAECLPDPFVRAREGTASTRALIVQFAPCARLRGSPSTQMLASVGAPARRALEREGILAALEFAQCSDIDRIRGGTACLAVDHKLQ